jgi:hypothetical protein
MSELFPVIDIDYKKRKPSKAVIFRTLGEYIKQGGKAFTITWGENCIDLTWHNGYQKWHGSGWIKDIDGDGIAQELNTMRKEAQKFIKDHFIFYRVQL